MWTGLRVSELRTWREILVAHRTIFPPGHIRFLESLGLARKEDLL